MAAFNQALTRVQQDCPDLRPDRINQLARTLDHTFRNTLLTPGNTLRFFVQQVAHGNIACSAMRHLTGEDFTDSAWCQARSRLPLELIQQVHRQWIEGARRELSGVDDVGDGSYRWHGHRLHVVEVEGRRLLIGTGPSGPPQLLTELAELPAWAHAELGEGAAGGA